MTILQPDAFIENNNITEMDTLIVVTKEEIPYVMMNSGKTGNAAYDGFAIDLLKVRINSTSINQNSRLMPRICKMFEITTIIKQ